jgi:hypothetical protein
VIIDPSLIERSGAAWTRRAPSLGELASQRTSWSPAADAAPPAAGQPHHRSGVLGSTPSLPRSDLDVVKIGVTHFRKGTLLVGHSTANRLESLRRLRL